MLVPVRRRRLRCLREQTPGLRSSSSTASGWFPYAASSSGVDLQYQLKSIDRMDRMDRIERVDMCALASARASLSIAPDHPTAAQHPGSSAAGTRTHKDTNTNAPVVAPDGGARRGPGRQDGPQRLHIPAVGRIEDVLLRHGCWGGFCVCIARMSN